MKPVLRAAVAALLPAALLVAAPLQAQPAPGGGQPQPAIRMMRPPPPQLTGERADLPMELVENLPTVLATVNGQGPFRFGVDTGAAGYLRVTPALAQKLGLAQVGEALAADPSGRNPVRVPIYRAERLQLGGLTFTGVSASALSVSRPRIDGIIGISFFEPLLLTIDFGALRLTAEKGALPPANGKDVVELTLDRGVLPTVPLTVGTSVQRVHLDTGNTRYPFFMPADAIASLPTTGTPRDIGVAHTVSQEIQLKAVGLAAPVSIGATRLPVTDVGFPSAGPTGNIGSLALRTMAVTIDTANRRVRVVPSRH
jgi:predicted aspartyl protease